VKGSTVTIEAIGFKVEADSHGMRVSPERNGPMIGPETMGYDSAVLGPGNPFPNPAVYWVWGDGEYVQWGDDEVMEQ